MEELLYIMQLYKFCLEIVQYLINAGADWTMKGKGNDVVLLYEYTLRERSSIIQTPLSCRWTCDHAFRICESTPI